MTATERRMRPTLAFYAPLKPPDHPNPSGDRLLARLLMHALDQAGFEVRLASRLRSRDAEGLAWRQQRLKSLGERLAQRLLRQWQRQRWSPQIWFTYHLYYKAPDWIGPIICRELGIPYVVAEASWAGKRAGGPWNLSHRQLSNSLAQADRIFTFNPADVPGLRAALGPQAPIIELPPFLDRQTTTAPVPRPELAEHYGLDPGLPWLVSVAMMRPGDKLASYLQLAAAFRRVHTPCQLLLVGDGSARDSVAAAFAGDRRVRLAGRLDARALMPLLSACQLMVWPAVNEAFGMALLEAQSCGLPVIAGNIGGVGNIVAEDATGRLVPPDDPAALADAIDQALARPGLLARWSRASRLKARSRHSLDAAAGLLRRELEPLLHA